MDEKHLQQELRNLGLTKNQAAIYMTLVGHGQLRIQEIVNSVKLPRSSVYEALKGLFELGIAEEIVSENHKIIRPYPIGIIKHGLDEQARHYQKLAEDVTELEKHLDIVNQGKKAASLSVRSYKGRSGARQLYWNTLKAEDTMYVYSDWGRARYIGKKFYESFVAESRTRKIKERVLINASAEALESIRIYTYPGSPISRTRMEDIRVVDTDKLAIKGDTLIYNETYAQVYLSQVQITGFEIENSHFVATQRIIFETYWDMARPISEVLV